MEFSNELCEGFTVPDSESIALLINHSLCFLGPMAVKWAVQLHIPEHIHKYGKPMPLHDLARAIPIPPSKETRLGRLMRLLVKQGLFEESTNQASVYSLTPLSRLLISNAGPKNMSALMCMMDELLLKPLFSLSEWFKLDGTATPFKRTYGKEIWELMSENPQFNEMFNKGMACQNYHKIKGVVQQYPEMFRGAKSLVDVGGGNGITVSVIAETFPDLKCTVFDLPHVISTMPESKVFDKVAGSMFETVPSADIILICDTLHNWSDEHCIKILKKCKEAIHGKENGGKVMIMDKVIGLESDVPKASETLLFHDMMMMVVNDGKERDEQEWKNIIDEAGYSHYKIYPTNSVCAIMEIFP
ncbi:hypothetical protein LUZ60_017685 [Juncus effusus]|nr:hypothetical protein LUZ60_017685 [Juncus effusus]